MRWKHLPIVAFDTETTGLDPHGGDRIVEIALVEIHLGDDGRPARIERYAHLVDPGVPIPRKVTEITGLTDADVQGKPRFETVAREVARRLGQGIAVAHNYPFDNAFVKRELEAVGVPWQEPLAVVDTVDVSLRVFPEARSHKLADLVKRLDVELVEAHRAANDAEACGRAFVEMARRAQIPDELDALLDWADAVGRPPEGGPFVVDEYGVPLFAEEEAHPGEPVQEHPAVLAWMEQARELRADGWAWRYPESARRWAARWLRVRASGRLRQSGKSFRPSDWMVDPPLVDPRTRRT
jgi:DNA polymerase III epsilon subunit family exonuclease